MNIQRNGVRLLATAGALTLMVWLAAPAWAVDGVLEINQASVKAAGEFPFVISQSGSYRLTSNLDVTDVSARPMGHAAENTTAISVTANNVTIDLNGFAILGPTVAGTGRGIVASLDVQNLAIANGTIQGMGNDGVAESSGLVERVRATGNGSTGIAGGDAGVVANCDASHNHNDGIEGGTVTSCTATFNGSYGIAGVTVTGCTAHNNGFVGINAQTVTGSTADSNGAGSTASGITAQVATSCEASSNTGSPQISAVGIKGLNICSGAPCP